MNPRVALLPCLVAIGGLASFAATQGNRAPEPPRHWYKGNTHTHTLNSDGDSTRCRAECPGVFSDRDSLMAYENLSCKDAVEYIDGDGTRAAAVRTSR